MCHTGTVLGSTAKSYKDSMRKHKQSAKNGACHRKFSVRSSDYPSCFGGLPWSPTRLFFPRHGAHVVPLSFLGPIKMLISSACGSSSRQRDKAEKNQRCA